MRRAGYLLAAALLLIFGGCSEKQVSTPSVLSPDKRYMEALRHTQKGDIAISLENKAQIIATYLNPIDKKYRGGEFFFVRVYIDNDFEDENRSGLYNPYYSLTLDGAAPQKIESVAHDEAAAMDMPFVQKWYKLYVVEFPKSDAGQLRLTFSHRDFGAAELVFQNHDAY